MDEQAKPQSGYDYRIVCDPAVCGGEPVFQGTSVPLRAVLISLSAGYSAEDILSSFPDLTADDVKAAQLFAASSDLKFPTPTTLPPR